MFLEHRADNHPERPERLTVIMQALVAVRGLRQVAPRLATHDELRLVHTDAHIDRMRRLSESGGSADADTYLTPRTFHVARTAVGALLTAVDHIATRKARNAFCAVRPPGHHATPDRAMGFCIFNQVAVAARYIQRTTPWKNVMIVDFDVHHGNGTQAAFYRDPTVLYLSVHQFPFYPGTGDADEIGDGPGRGFTVNVPYPAGMGDAEYLFAFDTVFLPVLRAFRPEAILVSAGFDAHARDPLGGMRVSEAGFRAMARRLRLCAEDLCGGRIVAVLEGGYDLLGLSRSAVATVLELEGGHEALESVVDPDARAVAVIERVRGELSPCWPALR